LPKANGSRLSRSINHTGEYCMGNSMQYHLDAKENRVAMKKAYILKEIVVFLLISGVLLTGALHSDSFTGTTYDQAQFLPSAVEPRDNIYGAAVIDGRYIWLVGKNGKVVFSQDAGQTWLSQVSNCAQTLQDVGAWDSKRVVAVGNNGVVMVSADGGASWQPVDVPKSEVANKLLRVITFNGGRALACGVMGTVLETSDYGRSWQRITQEKDQGFNDIHFADDAVGVIVGEFGIIQTTTDAGKSWKIVPSPVEDSLMSVAFKDNTIAVAVGLNGNILRTGDGGRSWNKIGDGVTKEHLFKVIWDGNHWVITGNKGVILIGDSNAQTFQAKKLSKTELLWHTDIELLGDKYLIVGGSQGLYQNGTWSYLF